MLHRMFSDHKQRRYLVPVPVVGSPEKNKARRENARHQSGRSVNFCRECLEKIRDHPQGIAELWASVIAAYAKIDEKLGMLKTIIKA
jgi:hypothetical protein